ncbi:VOC family protein [Altererythrobacter sp. MF3-039]|uniref:VOC family protein n=1 Tax=Altererythrobacter sp. MF3-039 TaxID=3252901 RepID=UPI00390C4464
MTDIIKRTTLIVRDAEKAAQWYENVFGMTRWMDTPFTLSGEQLAAGEAGDQTRLVIMKAQDDVIGMIGLLQWVDPVRDDLPDAIPDRIAFGTPVFVVASQDTRGALERARAGGSKIYCEPRDWSVTGADGKVKDMLGASFWDLDGYFYEVNQVVKVHD